MTTKTIQPSEPLGSDLQPKKNRLASGQYMIMLTMEEFENAVNAAVDNAFKRHFVEKETDRTLSIDEACEILQISRSTINVWSRAGLLPKKRIGRRVFFLESDIKKMIESMSDTASFPA